MKNFLKFISVVAASFILTFIVGQFFNTKTVSAQSGGSNYITKMNVSTGVSVGDTSTLLLPASSGRVYAVIVNDGSEPVYLAMTGGGAAVANSGVRLNADGGSYEINFLNQYVGAIYGITATSTSNVTVSASQ